MITVTTPFTPDFSPYLPPEFQDCKAIYFDIETTGLSAQSSYVYLIGCTYKEENTFCLTQWMCTEPAEEKELLRLFFDKAKNYDLILHYNGTGFDLPFLEKKAKRHCLTNPLSSLHSLDLYWAARKLKEYLPTEDLKLKSMEQFFGFPRTDTFSGGDLIEVYAHFLGLFRLNELTDHSKEQEVTALRHVLLLHNAEDIKNLPSLTVLLFLQNLTTELTPEQIHSTPHATSPEIEAALANISLTPVAVSVEYDLSFTLPKSCELCFPFNGQTVKLTLSANGHLMLLLPTFTGTLKYFYPNPSDYYYLPLEDCAMHKSVASFVEKEFRKKATAATCYTKKEGTFVPLALRTKKTTRSSSESQQKEAQTEANASLPCFLSDYKSNFCYTPHVRGRDAETLTLLAKSVLSSFL